MIIKFASDLIKITFEKNEPFEDRSLVVYGEVITCGFAAIVPTMSWLSPYKKDVSNNELPLIRDLIQNYNKESKFFIDLVEG
ncbi:MAG: hypothetical protein IJC17_04780 [Clostridia bacterium]|nr:hypothetical protein [Clostridia bacterium]